MLQIVKLTNLSSFKLARVCKQLSDHVIDIPTPTQPAIYQTSVRESKKMQQNFEEVLKNENWALHFDNKKINKQEMQVVVLKIVTTKLA